MMYTIHMMCIHHHYHHHHHLYVIRDVLEDCLRYKSFLDALTPVEWFEQHKRRHQEKVDAIQRDNYRIKYKEWDRVRRKLAEGIYRVLFSR